MGKKKKNQKKRLRGVSHRRSDKSHPRGGEKTMVFRGGGIW